MIYRLKETYIMGTGSPVLLFHFNFFIVVTILPLRKSGLRGFVNSLFLKILLYFIMIVFFMHFLRSYFTIFNMILYLVYFLETVNT